MAGIVVCGAGACGLTTAMMLAKDGHRVTVLERDAAAPPEPSRAWEDWERRGVNQFRLPHFLLPAFREVMEAELPEILTAMTASGAHRFNLLGPFANAMDPEGRHDVVTARRPLVEAVIAAVASDTPDLVVRRGVAVVGVLTEGATPPRVVGLLTEGGDEIRADLVVDAGGRRSPMVRWLIDAGVRPPLVEEEDSGFVYYGRHVRAPTGVALGGPGTITTGSVGLLVLPAEDDISGIGIIAHSDDADLRVLRHEAAWTAAMGLLPGGEPILDSEFVSPLQAMAGLEDRWRRCVIDGQPVATGVVSVGDAWASTNPSLGRGISLGVRHARALRDSIREVGLDADRIVRQFDEVTDTEFNPWYRSTVWHDRHRAADLRTAAGADAPDDDPLWTEFLRFEGAARQDPEVLLPRFLDWIHLTERPEQTLADPLVRARLDELGAGVPAPTGPCRADLLDAVGVSR